MGVAPSREVISSQPGQQEPNKTQPQGSKTERANSFQQSAKEEPVLPHNYEEILKDAESQVDKSSKTKLYDQLCAGVFLNKKQKKYWVERESRNNCFMLFAPALSITWGDDKRYWDWPLFKEPSTESFVGAELKAVCWLEIHGKFKIAYLSPGVTYEVVFVVKMKDGSYGWGAPVNFGLALPDGTRKTHQVNLMEKPREQWIEIRAGELETTSAQQADTGEIDISLWEYDSGQWKNGLLVKGVIIRPKK